MRLDMICHKVQVASLMNMKEKPTLWWDMTQDMTRTKIEKTFKTYKKDEVLYQHKLTTYMNAFP